MHFARLIRCLCLCAALCGATSVYAQRENADLSDGEVEKLRDAAYVPVDRIDAFVKILDSGRPGFRGLVTGRRRPGREEQLHDLFDQFNGIADELNDNLDAYGPKHRDLRKALPKLLLAAERWSTVLRSAPNDPAYKVVQKLALDAVHDVQEAATAMNTEQIAYFKAHPEAAKAEKERVDPRPSQRETIDIPR